MNWIMDVPVFILGLAAGSFLNVVIHRLPRGNSVARPRSFCPRCEKTLRWYDNVPLLSYMLLRGRCRRCGLGISPRYPAVEFLGGALAVFSLRLHGEWFNAAFAYAFLMALLAVTLIDWRHRIIPDRISISFIFIGLAWSFFNPALSLLSSSVGAAAGGGFLWIVGAVYQRLRGVEGMGGGDVKLMAMIGAWLGAALVLPVIVIASLCGSLYGLALIRRGGDGGTAVAFGSFLAPAAAVCLCAGPAVSAWYLGLF